MSLKAIHAQLEGSAIPTRPGTAPRDDVDLTSDLSTIANLKVCTSDTCAAFVEEPDAGSTSVRSMWLRNCSPGHAERIN